MSFQVADDANTDYKELVRKGYNLCADTYSHDRSIVHERELGLVTERLPAASSVLDVGCGSGVPVTSYLAARHRVTGVDISASMIALARENVPAAHFITADIMSVDFENNAFDAIVSFYAVFHVPRQEHQGLFRRFARWLKPNGLLLVTLASNTRQ